MTEIDRLDEEIEALEGSLAGASGMAAAFQGEMQRLGASLERSSGGARRFEAAMSRGVSRAIDGVVLDGDRLSDALKTVAQSMIDASWRAAVKPVSDHVGGLITQGVGAVFGEVAPFAKGGSFSQGRVMPFARGGIVQGPTTFPMRGGTGLMGEAGPEAILPLTRGPDGSLRVQTRGGGGVTVVMNVQTPDVASFRRSQSQIAAQMGRMLARGQRNR